MRIVHMLAPLALVGPAIAADQSPAVADAVVDLRTAAGAAMVRGRWRYADAHIVAVEGRLPGPDKKATGAAVRTHDVHPRIGSEDFERAPWIELEAEDLEARRTTGRLAFGWYRIDITLPERIGAFEVKGSTAVLEIVVDDYAEVWVDGSQARVLGQSGGPVVKGWNSPNRVTIARDARPGQTVRVAVFGANGPLSDPPANFVWIRSATLDLYKGNRGMANIPAPVDAEFTRRSAEFDAVVSRDARIERLADGFVFGEGPVWAPPAADDRYGGGGKGGYLLFSDPNKNVIHRYDPATGEVSIYRTKSGYSGMGGRNIGEYHQPGSNGLALDGEGRLTICEHGNRRVTRLEPNGTITVLADRYEGRRLNSPNDLVYRSDGALFFTDPPFGLPRVFDDSEKELEFSGVYCLYNGVLRLVSTDLAGPNGLAFSPDERHLYVDNWDERRKVIMRYAVGPDGALSNPVVFSDLTNIPGEICFDGMKVDSMGHVYASGPGGVWVYSPTGKHLGTISPPELPANFAFGDDDGRTLYMTARTGLYRMRVGFPGAGWSR